MANLSPSNPLVGVPLFADLSPDVLDQFLDGSWMRCYPRGQVLVSQGDQCEEFKLLEAGRVRFSRFGVDGREVVIGARSAPTVFGEMTVFDGARCTVTLIADTDVALRLFSVHHVRSVIEQHPEAAMAMLRTMAGILRDTNERLMDMMTLDASGRLAKWLVTRSQDSDDLTIPQSQEALARSLGTSRVTVNRLLRQFDRLGLIETQGRRVRVVDRRGLLTLVA